MVPVHGFFPPGGNVGSVALKPSKQAHKYPPTMLLQIECSPQIPEVVWHSSVSDEMCLREDIKDKLSIEPQTLRAHKAC